MKQLLDLAAVFGYLSLLTVGGGMAAFPELKSLTVDTYHWVTFPELMHYYGGETRVFRGPELLEGQPDRLWNTGETCLDAFTQRIEALLHTANAFEQARIDQRGYRLSVLANDHAVTPVLHLVEHLPEVLPKVDGAGFRNHGA